MKVGIVTHPLGNNYGGLMQAYALQQSLKRLGHDAWIFQKLITSRKRVFLRSIRNFTYSLFHKFYVSQKDKYILSRHMLYFSDNYICPKTPKFSSDKSRIKYVAKHDFDALIVGSDQVWRPLYVGDVEYYFLSFLNKTKIKRISYAASFGVDKWEFSIEQTEACRSLLKQFDAVSVREDSGLSLCEKYLGCNAELVLDPTFLLEKDDYIRIIMNENQSSCDGELFCYFLDQSSDVKEIINVVEKSTNLSSFTCMPKKTLYSEMNSKNKSDFTYPPVSQWLRSFFDAKMILTDSFHGCVFSIIFNKPFWVVANKKRGGARFESLLKMFGLQDRIIKPGEIESIQLDKIIDWDKVNSAKDIWKDRSLNFLISALS